MATYYVGIGGNDGNSGLTWALRKLTLNGAEDVPVAAGDTVYVGPGVYRELLTCDIDGGVGNEIVYIADVTGEHTDDVGGIVRISGSNDDQTQTRAYCVDGNGKDYRIFRGFFMDSATSYNINADLSPVGWIIEDCSLQGRSTAFIYFSGDAQDDNSVLRCRFMGPRYGIINIYFFSAAGIQDIDSLVQNCTFLSGTGVQIAECGGVDVRNCTMLAPGSNGVYVSAAPPGGYTANNVENCILAGCYRGLRATALGEIVEDYNLFYGNNTDRLNVNVGGNSVTYQPLWLPPLLHSGTSQAHGYQFPWWMGELSEWSEVRAITGSNEPGIDMWGCPRPTTASKNSWGAFQFQDMELESGTVQAGTYGRALNDAGAVLVRRVPCTNVSTTVTLYMRYEANYAGNLPRMTIKQPGVADRHTVMVAAANTWEQLSDTFTPNASPGYFEVWAESRNTNGANDKVFYDTLEIS